MSIVGQKTNSDYIEWDKLQSLTQKLERDCDYKFTLLITIGMYTGLRISDTLSLRWKDILDKDWVEITERNTGKQRKISINPNLMYTLQRLTTKIHPDPEKPIFLNDRGTKTISRQWVNDKLKRLVKRYEVVRDSTKIKSHSIRKSFGRRVWENSERSE